VNVYPYILSLCRESMPKDIIRAAAIVLLNTLAKGYSNVRPQVAALISLRLSKGPPLADVPLYGTTHLLCYLLHNLKSNEAHNLNVFVQIYFRHDRNGRCDPACSLDQGFT
jgi:hypothetical protein